MAREAWGTLAAHPQVHEIEVVRRLATSYDTRRPPYGRAPHDAPPPPTGCTSAGSSGLSNGWSGCWGQQSGQSLGWCVEVQGRSWSTVEGVGDALQVLGGVHGEVC